MAEFAACDSRPRSPMMTVSGIAAEGLSPNLFPGWIAAESVSPQLTAVLGPDTELRIALIPVMMNIYVENSATKIRKIPHTTSGYTYKNFVNF